MASEFVRKVKGIRNIDILSPNITTENDLISTIDGNVYVATKKGYKRITGVETKEIKQLKTDVSNLKIQSDTNTLNISDNTDDIETNTSDIETNTSEIETLKTTTDNNTSEIDTLETTTNNNTSEIETLQTSTDNNTSEIETLKTSTDNNTSEIETLQTSTGNNTSEIDLLKNKIEDIEININSLNEYIEVETFNGIDLMDKNSLNTLPLGVNYVIRTTNKTDEMTKGYGWLTVHFGNNVKRFMFQPYNEPRTYYNNISKDTLGEWE